MTTLLMRLNNPIQSFGTSSDLYRHNLVSECPTYSAVLGIVANAMGVSREDDITELAQSYSMGSVTLKAPKIMDDYQNAGVGDKLTTEERLYNIPKPDKLSKDEIKIYNEIISMSLLSGIRKSQNSIKITDDGIIISHTFIRDDVNAQINKYYLVGGDYLVALNGNEEAINMAYESLNNPERYLFVGRKNCPINPDFLVGKSNLDLYQALHNYTVSLISGGEWDGDPKVTFYLPATECNVGVPVTLRDYPLSWSSRNRKYAPRELKKFSEDFADNIVNDSSDELNESTEK